MTQTQKSFDLLSPEQRKKVIQVIIDHFATERDEELGIIAAGDLLDVILETITPHIFNKGVIETKKLVQTQLQELDFEIDTLLKETK